VITEDLRLLREAARRVGFPLERLGWNRWLEIVSYGSRPAVREGALPLDFGRGWSVGPRDLTLAELSAGERLSMLRILIKNRSAWWELLNYGRPRRTPTAVGIVYR
jgi:hypothetical protein